MALKIDKRGAKLPSPDEKLYRQMGECAYAEFAEVWSVLRSTKQAKKEGKLLPWSKAGQDKQMAWTSAMRVVWTYLALTGGAKSRTIRPKK